MTAQGTPAVLAGVRVLDLSRMLPGAVLARCLLDLGAALTKVEDPRGGDPMRRTPPLVGGVGLGFAVHYRGADALSLDLRAPADVTALRARVAEADVLVESFRPGTMARWGLDPAELRAAHPRLITCSLPGAPTAAAGHAPTVGHDLNFVAQSGLLRRLGDPDRIPRAQIADVTCGLLAAQAVLAALLLRERTGHGTHIEQPIASGPLPFLWWPWAEVSAGAPSSAVDTLLDGRLPAYRTYTCGDGGQLAVGCLEPKFWRGFCEAVGRPDLVAGGLDPGPAGQACAREMAAHLATAPLASWLTATTDAELPVGPVRELSEAAEDPLYDRGALLEDLPLPGGGTLRVPGPALPSVGRTPSAPAPARARRDGAHETGPLPGTDPS